MRLVVLGCGRVGSTLASLMSREGHEVSVLDRDPESFRRLMPEYTGSQVVGLGIDEEALKRAGIEQADAFVAATSGDNTNLMASQIAGQRFGVPRVIARIYDPIRALAYRQFGIDTLCSTTLLSGVMRDYLLGRPYGSVEEYLDIRRVLSP
jgi:trk system potassium uptake protein TrkA